MPSSPLDGKVAAWRDARPEVRSRARWELLARPKQLPPDWGWFVWLILAGRGWGKTLTGAQWTADKARRHPGCRIALVAQTFGDGRDTMVEGETGLLSVLANGEVATWNRSLGELGLRNGSKLKVFSSEKPKQLRGPQHHFAWGDEPSTWYDAFKGPSKDTTWSNLAFGCRAAYTDDDGTTEPQICLTGTPQPVRLLTQRDREPMGLLHRSSTAITRGHTDENLANLAESFRREVIEPVRGTRLGQQELAAAILEDIEGALWKRDWIDRHRVTVNDLPDRQIGGWWQKKRVAIDPSDGLEDGDEQGLAVVGLGADWRMYVLESEGLRTNPYGLCKHAIAVSERHGRCPIVVEKNHGGEALKDLLELAMRELGRRVPYQMITASKSKMERADPIATLYEQETKGVHHVGYFPELEDQMTSHTFARNERSPDRLDALVHGLTELMGGNIWGAESPDAAQAVPWSDRTSVGGAVAWS